LACRSRRAAPEALEPLGFDDKSTSAVADCLDSAHPKQRRGPSAIGLHAERT